MPSNALPIDAVKETLRSTGHQALAQLDVVHSDGAIVLVGNVPTFHLKQLAQEAALSVPGVAMLRNDLEVTGRPRRRAE